MKIKNNKPEETYEDRKKRKQDTCSHLKGGRFQSAEPKAKDYNVSQHTFIDGSTRIICNTCQKIWRPNEPGWADALLMVKESTNKPSSSEVAIRPAKKEAPVKKEKKPESEKYLATIETGYGYSMQSNDIVTSGMANEIKLCRFSKVFTFKEMTTVLRKARYEKLGEEDPEITWKRVIEKLK